MRAVTNLIVYGMSIATCAAGGKGTAGGAKDGLGPPPGQYRILSEDGSVRIPFEIHRNDLRLEAEVNGTRLRMLVDNGFLWDELLFFGSPRIDALGLDPDGEIDVRGSGEGDSVRSSTASGVSIRFGGIEFHDQEAVITPYGSGITELWAGADGQVSAAFFKHFVVDVDFDASVLTLIRPEDFDAHRGDPVTMVPLGRGAFAIPAQLEMTDGSLVAVLLQLDLGLGDPLALAVGGPDGIVLPEDVLEASLGFGAQGEILGHYGRVRSVRIGDHVLEDVLAGFTSATGANPVNARSYVGHQVLSRFNLVFDYPGSRLFLAPNRRFSEPFHYNMSGMGLRPGEEGLLVARVHSGSPAADEGLRPGDVVTAIDGRPVSDYAPGELAPLFRREGAKVALAVQRGGRAIPVTLTLRRVI